MAQIKKAIKHKKETERWAGVSDEEKWATIKKFAKKTVADIRSEDKKPEMADFKGKDGKVDVAAYARAYSEWKKRQKK